MEYIITYTNYFKIGNSTFAFRKRELFDISNVPVIKQQIEVSGCKGYWLIGKFHSLSSLQKIVVVEPVKVDVSDLQWNIQIQLNHVFNL